MSRKLVFFTLVFLMLSISFVSPASGLFGSHDTCPRCYGVGRDPATLFVSSCPRCGGDGEVGIFIDDEGLEDVLSFLLVGGIVIVAIAGVASAASKPKRIRQPPSSPPQEPIVLAICPQCNSRIPSESKFCPKCGTNLQPNKKTT